MFRQKPWWQSAVIYQIYPRSFQDSNGDGLGDLPGIISRLDYLKDLGIDAIWLSPVYPSPMYDFGYDISSYTQISGEFGTMDDFRTLLSQAHSRGIRIVMDLVLNHTSHQHPWFQEASASRGSPQREWYIWHDPKPGLAPRPPNNWLAAFGGSAWQWQPSTKQYYLHSFLKEQPDVNWRNPGLRQAMEGVMRFWLDMGVDGFRLDVANWFIKDHGFRNNPGKILGIRPYDRQHHLYDRNRPETLEIMRHIRSVLDQYPQRMCVGEVYSEPPGNPKLAASYYGAGKGLHLVFNFAFLYCPWKAKKFAQVINQWEKLLGEGLWPSYVLSNHDQPRSISRYARGQQNKARARLLAALILTLKGTPFLYYGEEIGMTGSRIPRRFLQDPLGKRYWPFHPGRDGARTPMQWDQTLYAGFSNARPWLPVNKDHQRTNVEAERKDKNSLLNWYRALIQIRKAEPALHSGEYQFLKVEKDVLAYLRQWQKEQVLIALNFSSKVRALSLAPAKQWQVLLSTQYPVGQWLTGPDAVIDGYGVVIAKAKKEF